MRSVRVTTRETGTVRGTARRRHFPLATISVTVQLRIQVFWVRSAYFNVRNILPKSGTFPPGHPVYLEPHIGVYLTTPSNYRIISEYWKRSGKKVIVANPCTWLKMMRNVTKASFATAGLSAEILTRDLPSTRGVHVLRSPNLLFI